MNYLKSLTKKQWLIIFAIIVFFIVAYFIFFNKKSSTDQAAADLEVLMRQGQATKPINESLTKSEINILMKRGIAATSSAQRSPKEIKAEEDALLRLMSVPKK